MGLDMYLEAKWHVVPCDSQTEPMRRAIGAAIGYVPSREKPGRDPSLLEISGVTVRVGYWRKFGALHRWFVGNAQEGSDDCCPAYVDNRCLQDLQRMCERVIDNPACVTQHFSGEDGADLDVEELQYTLDILSHAIVLQEQGWDIYYRASW
ncbi:hypothetical protein ABNK63_16255 [Rhodanobacter sp. IGA1.0]|uniref:Uncharacterized protein n=1 Tax=Rhodanobacter sp. IGA1.0 TaxID=3158582 RepID=A0AAU7QKS0_9GAMM